MEIIEFNLNCLYSDMQESSQNSIGINYQCV